MPDGYTAGPQMLNELFNFPTGVELLGVPTAKDDGVQGSKLNSDSNWRVLNPYEYACGFNTQKDGNLNMQSVEAMSLLNQAKYGGDYSGHESNGVIDRHPRSNPVDSTHFQLPGFLQSLISQGLYNPEQAPSGDSWQKGDGVNELLLLPTSNGNLLQNSNHFAPKNTVNWANSSIQRVPSSSKWCEPSPMTARGERSLQGLSLSLSSNSQVQMQRFDANRPISSHDIVYRVQASADAKNKSADILHGSQVGFFSSLSRSEGVCSAKRYWNPNSASSGKLESRYAKPTQQLLEEFCNVAGNGVNGNVHSVDNLQKSHRENWFVGQNITGSGLKVEQSVSMSETAGGKIGNEVVYGNCSKEEQGNAVELRRRKAKLQWMFDEVERRYAQYSEQMKIIVTSFESAAGVGAATTYTCLATKAMSRHFKCLKDCIVDQIKQTNEALGEKETSVPGVTKGETPRLKLIEQSLRLRRTFQPVGMFEQDVWRPQRGLPERAVTLLRAWLFEHFLNPYPSHADKHFLARQTGLSKSQVSNWFINARVRLWKPMVEEMYQEEAKEAEMEEEDANSNLNNHEKDILGANASKDMTLNALDSSGCAMVLGVESQHHMFDSGNSKGNLCKEEVTGITSEDNANKVDGVDVACLNFSGHNSNGTSNNSG
ncbi:hypothetical protein KI387_014464 [Taxus chinensis]|uniref:Homeobox domain-containing protein n=1 Tax=Taxus chinensis TaxID=29808 RepID=A0AA38CNE3_TAXCH|nr:hypothetical protein KI387_014464 [Taxus chinensis]